MDYTNFSRVYINPNFNRGLVRNDQNYTNMTNINAMHFNPNFPNNQNKKIYINPNFVPSASMPVPNIEPCQWKTIEKAATTTPNNNDLSASTVAVHNMLTQIRPPVTNMSRYRLVRHNENKPPAKPNKPDSLTVKLSKYKSVRVDDVKLKLDKVKQPVLQFSSSSQPTQSSSHTICHTHRENTMNTSYKAFKAQYTFTKNKEVAKRTQNYKHQSVNMAVKRTPKIKIRKLKLKCTKPCRLFRKYGKCMRNDKGVCKYMHDKKHVSICKKFLKGVCHDKNCLLSHELSDKKMPTCYFYLQGMCTKEACPYLHVKVNEKAIVCPDFKKGYCEKGSTCLYRHVETTKKRKKKLINPPMKYCNRVKIKVIEEDARNKNINMSGNEKLSSTSSDATAITDCRYYKDAIMEENNSESCEVIKPSRCKLGTLPSFIKL